MTYKFKKIILVAFVLVLSLSFTVCAESTVKLKTPKEFFVHENEPDKVAEILDMDKSELTEYCINNSILYLAVNKDNTKQIRVTVSDNAFSNGIINLSNLSDAKITNLASDIAGIKGVRGDTIDLNGQKFLKIQLQSSDSGGEYILTQYITVAEKQNIVLSFYNSKDVSDDYITKVFESFTSKMFINNQKTNILLIIIPIIAIVLLIICIVLGISLVRDIIKNKEDEENEEDEEIISENEITKEEPEQKDE